MTPLRESQWEGGEGAAEAPPAPRSAPRLGGALPAAPGGSARAGPGGGTRAGSFLRTLAWGQAVVLGWVKPCRTLRPASKYPRT